MKILIIFIILTQIGCAELIGYTIGTTSNVTKVKSDIPKG